jgi:alginate O-acetyltransferase complex protein AlgI
MVFSSVLFLFFFLPCAWTAYFFSWKKSRNLVLLLASLVFYLWGEREHVFVLLLSILINYFIGISFCFLDQQGGKGVPGFDYAGNNVTKAHTLRARKLTLVIGIALNLVLLGFYKYVNFLVSNLNLSLAWFDFGSVDIGRISAPLGISFFTFHALSYVIDTYESRATPQKNPLKFALYLAVFPKILAGPIIKYHQAENQLADRHLTVGAFLMGIKRFIIGLGKKVLIANPLAAAADKVFAIPAGELGFDVAWLGIICFTLQIYFDFSGYTDMAIGLGKTFGFEFPENFNYPYVSQSVQEFWRRWHITLSSWFRDYLYIPLGGNRCSPAKHYRNLIAVFLLCGLWHGASWNFILWGLWYGFFLVLETLECGQLLRTAWRPLRHLYALAVTVIGWVLFRADSLFHALQYLMAMSGLGTAESGQYYIEQYVDNEVLLMMLVGAIGALPLSAFLERLSMGVFQRFDLLFRPVAFGVSIIQITFLSVLFLLSCMAVAGGTHSPFIYFKF